MKLSAKKTILKNQAKMVMAGNYQASITALMFFSIITLLLSRFTGALSLINGQLLVSLFHLAEDNVIISVFSYAISFLLSVVASILQIGLCLFFLNVVTGKPHYAFDMLYGYYHGFQKSFLLCLVPTAFSFVCTLPANILLDDYEGSFYVNENEKTILLILQAILLLVYIIANLALSQIFYLALDYPDLSVKEILLLSIKLMNGRKKQLFLIQLSFLPLWILAILSMGIGMFWVIPYQRMTYTLYYLDIMKPQDN